MAKRRGNGEGSVYRRKDGLWVGQYKIEAQNSTKKTKYIYAKTRKEAARRLTGAIAERDKGIAYDSEGLTLEGYLSRWLGSVEGTIRPRAYERYEQSCRLHINPTLGNIKLDKLKTAQLQNLYREKLGSGLSPRTVQIIHATLHKSLAQAVALFLLPRNLAALATPPRANHREMKPLSEERVKVLLEASKGDKLEALYVLAVTTGMRKGELLGLKWDDVDLGSRTVRVKRTVHNGKVHPPKTARGNRSVSLSRDAVVSLEHREKLGEWVFCTRTGNPISAQNVHNRSWKPLLKRACLPLETRFHDLRHTCATLLLTKGVHPKIVQEMLGHSSISVTLDIYSHVLPNMQGEAVRAMDSFFERS
jgi:integrase